MSKRAPTQEAFDRLLCWLDPDREKAGARYEKIRLRLIRIFACRGCCDSEDLADQTINVVSAKSEWLIENYEGEPELYFYAVAKKIFLEHLKRQAVADSAPPAPDTTPIELQSSCLDQCLQQELTDKERDLVLRYFHGEGQERIRLRKELAQKLGISLNALRIKMCHLIARLRPCMNDCLRQSPDA